MRKVLMLGAVIAITNLPIGCGCDTGNCDDDGDVLQESTINTIVINNAWLDDDFIAQAVTTDYEVAAISLEVTEVDFQEVALQNNHSTGSLFINSAFARLRIAPPPTQLLEEILITSNDDVFSGGQTLSAGSDLSTLFTVSSISEQFRNLEITDFIDAQNTNLYLFGSLNSLVIFKLSNKPDQPFNGNILIDLSFNDGSTFRLELVDFNVE